MMLIKLMGEIKYSKTMFGTDEKFILILLLTATIICFQNFVYLSRNATNHQRFKDANKEKRSANIIFMILSIAIITKRRQGIRGNWGDKSKFAKKLNHTSTYQVFFLTGLSEELSQIDKESKLYEDVLVTKRTENYYDISRRVLFEMCWSLESCKYNCLSKLIKMFL